MRTRTLSLVGLTLLLAAAAVAACTDSSSDIVITSDAGEAGTTPPPPPPGTDSAPAVDSAPPPYDAGPRVVFRYTPQWSGVVSVEVRGAFGTGSDWTTPYATLSDDGSGTFTGDAPLVGDQIPYVLKVIGDDAAATPASYYRYALDATNPAFTACPADSPTFLKTSTVPCSVTPAPLATAATHHVRGLVTSGGAPVAGYLVQLERDEPTYTITFVNRVTTAADGAFDLAAAPGSYRVSVLHPSYCQLTDAQRDPLTLTGVRRTGSSPFSLAADITINAAEVGFDRYDAMAPAADAGPQSLPVAFAYTEMPGASAARVSIYGPGTRVGATYFSSPFTKDGGGAEFDGSFSTAAAPDGGLEPDAQYWWASEHQFPRPDGGVLWTAQTLVLPIRFK